MGITCNNNLGTIGNETEEENKIIAWFGDLGDSSEALELVREALVQ